MHEACNRGHIQAARVLLNHGADVNAAASCGTTPLIDAASNGHNTIVKLLLEHGADPLQKDKHGMNAIDLALNNSIKSILNLYLQKKQQILPSSNDKEISTTNNCCNKSELDKFELIKIGNYYCNFLKLNQILLIFVLVYIKYSRCRSFCLFLHEIALFISFSFSYFTFP